MPSGLNLLDAYTEKDSMKGRIGRPSVQLKTYFVSGNVHTKEFYYKRTKMKGQKGVLHHREYNESYPFKKTIRARSIEDAKKKFKAMARDAYDTDEYDKKKEVKFNKFSLVSSSRAFNNLLTSIYFYIILIKVYIKMVLYYLYISCL